MAHHWPKELLIWHYTVLSLASGAVNYDYIVTNSIKTLLIGSRCIPNGTHVEPIWPMLQKVSKTLSTTLHTVAVVFFMHPHTNTMYIYIEFLELDGFQNYHEPLKANHDRCTYIDKII